MMTHFSSPFPRELSFLEEKAVNALSECWGLALFKTTCAENDPSERLCHFGEEPIVPSVWVWDHDLVFEMILHGTQAWH